MKTLLASLPAKIAFVLLVLLVGFGAGWAAPKNAPEPPFSGIPHCLAEDGGPQPVCIWDSAVDGDGTPAAPDNVVNLFVSRSGQDPIAHRIK